MKSFPFIRWAIRWMQPPWNIIVVSSPGDKFMCYLMILDLKAYIFIFYIFAAFKRSGPSKSLGQDKLILGPLKWRYVAHAFHIGILHLSCSTNIKLLSKRQAYNCFSYLISNNSIWFPIAIETVSKNTGHFTVVINGKRSKTFILVS